MTKIEGKLTIPYLSVVTPVYFCGCSLPELYSRLDKVLSTISANYEIVMVNDASPDDAWQVIQDLALKDPGVRGLNLSRNFGQHYAITAGLDYARGEWVIVMDCDLQDVPEEIAKLYSKAMEGCDIVVGRRAVRQDSFVRKGFSILFYRVFAYFAGSKVDHRIGSFGIYSKRVVRSICALKEQNRSFGLFALWVGFKETELDVRHAPRVEGRSSYSFRKMIILAIDSIVAHSNKLLGLVVNVGFVLSFISLLFALAIIVRYYIWSIPVIGWTSLIVSVYFTAGLILGSIGILGLYLGKIFDEVKRRPLYIIESMTFEITDNGE